MPPAQIPSVASLPIPSRKFKDATDPDSDRGRDRAELTPFERKLIAVFVDMMQSLGMPKSYGEIYGLLYATPKPLGFAEIHDRLPISKGSVSGGLKALREIGAVKAFSLENERREVYCPELEVRKLLLAYLQERIQPQLDSSIARMVQLESLLNSSFTVPSERKTMTARMGKLAKWRRKAAGLIPWIARFL